MDKWNDLLEFDWYKRKKNAVSIKALKKKKWDENDWRIGEII